MRDQAQSLLEIFTRTRREGVTLRSVEDDAFVTNQLLIGVAAEQANKYSADLSAFVKAGKARQFEPGERLGGPVRDGYRRVTELLGGNKVSRYDLDEERARIIRRAVELALPGAGAGAIARRLNAEGYRLKTGKPWNRRRVQDLLSNPFYAGLASSTGASQRSA